MNIDLLFFESSFEKKDDYIKDQEIFQEYINTHSFEGNSNELLFMPPSMSSSNNKTLLIGCEDISQNNKELLELGYSIGNKLKENCELKDNIPIILIGNKNDKIANRSVTVSEANIFAQQNNIEYFETNIYDWDGINTAFVNLVDKTTKHYIENGISSSGVKNFTIQNLNVNNKDKNFTNCCKIS